ncbi:SHOCT-like domain-containing protein [Pseudothermotoga sp.]
MREELLKLFRLVKDGKLSPEEALEIAETVGIFSQPQQPKKEGTSAKKMLYVQIRDPKGEKVDVKIPLSMAQLLKLSLPALREKLPGVDLEMVSKQIDQALGSLQELEGDIVNISSEDGTIVRLFIS